MGWKGGGEGWGGLHQRVSMAWRSAELLVAVCKAEQALYQDP